MSKTTFLGLELKCIYEPFRYMKYVKLVCDSPGNTVFNSRDYGLISIKNYFERRYDIKLRFPFMPLVQVDKCSKNIMIPLELLIISDKPQRIYKKFSPQQMEKLAKVLTFLGIKLFKKNFFRRQHYFPENVLKELNV